MALTAKWRRRWNLLGAGALVGLGLDCATPSSRSLMLLGTALTLGGIAWFLATLLSGRQDGVLYRKRKQIMLAAATTSITLLLVIAVALTLRIAPRHFAVENQRYDAELGWAPPPEVIGQRGQTADPSRDQVLLVGDSIVYGFGVEPDQTAAHDLEQILGAPQVLNLALSGWSIDQYYVYLHRVLRDAPGLRPKLVVVGIFTGNDYEVTSLEYGWGHTKPLFRLRDDQLVLHNPDLLADNCIDHMAQSLLFRVLWMRKDLALDLIDMFCNPARLGPEELERVIGKLFAGIEADAHHHGAQVLFVLLPTDKHLKDLEEGKSRYSYTRLRELLERGGHRYYEFYPDIVRAAGEDETGIFLDGAHYTPAGHKLLAESLARVIRQRGLLDGPPPAP